MSTSHDNSGAVSFTTRGVKLQVLLDFAHTYKAAHLFTCREIPECVQSGGEWDPNYWSEGHSEVQKTLAQMSTKDVCEVILKPLLSESKVSYCEYLRPQQQQQQPQQQQQESVGVSGSSDASDSSSSGSGSGSGSGGSSDLVGIATLFVSHAWKYKFSDVVNALARHLKDEPNTFIWFDLFSNNQWDAPALSFDGWCDTFKDAIQSIGRVVMVLTPWSNPIPFTRSWCLFELYCTIVTESKFEVAMSESEEESFVRDMIDDENESSVSYFTMLGNINVELSEAWNAEDKERILKFVTGLPGGAEAVNTMCCEKLRDYMCTTISKDIKITNDASEVVSYESLQLNRRRRRAMGKLLQQQSKFDEAKCVLEEVLREHNEILCKVNDEIDDVVPSDLLDVANKLIRAVNTDDELNDVERSDVLDVAQILNILGAVNTDDELDDVERSELLDVANVLNILGTVNMDLDQLEDAKRNLCKCLAIKKRVLDKSHVEVATVLLNIAYVFDRQGKYLLAPVLYEQCRSMYSSNDIDPKSEKWSDLFQIRALAYSKHEKYDMALEYFEKSLKILEDRGQSASHPNVGDIYTGMARVYRNRCRAGDTNLALEKNEQCLEIYLQTLGPSHSRVGTVHHEIACDYQALNDYNKSIEHCNECLTVYNRIFMSPHDYFAAVYNTMARVTSNFSESNEYYEQALQNINSQHPSAGHIYVSWGKLHEQQVGGVEKAKSCYEKSLEVYDQGKHPTGMADAYCGLARLCENEDVMESMRHYQKSLDIYVENLGDNHAHACTVRACLEMISPRNVGDGPVTKRSKQA
jgi:tetratricopeptide (TPR) repeat protein